MAAFKQIDAQEDEGKPFEVVGSASLKDALQDRPYIRGSFAINGVAIRNMEARSPGEVVRTINNFSNRTGVKAELDDQFHLVLTHESSEEIAILDLSSEDRNRQLRAIEERNRNQGDAAPKQEASAESNDHESVLEVLGLEQTEGAEQDHRASDPDWQPGRNAEDRQKEYERRRDAGMSGVDMPAGQQTSTEDLVKGLGGGGGALAGPGMNSGPSDTAGIRPAREALANAQSEPRMAPDGSMGRSEMGNSGGTGAPTPSARELASDQQRQQPGGGAKDFGVEGPKEPGPTESERARENA